MEPSLQNLDKSALNNGLIIGILSAVIGIVTYYVFPYLFGSMWFGIGNMIFLLIVYIFFTIDLRKKIGNYWNFREALRGIFLMSFIAGIVLAVINYLFYQFIEPGAFEKIAGFVESGASKTFEAMGMDQDQIDEAVGKQIEGMKAQFNPTFSQLLKNLGIGILVQFVMSLIFAAIFKKEAPMFASVDEE